MLVQHSKRLVGEINKRAARQPANKLNTKQELKSFPLYIDKKGAIGNLLCAKQLNACFSKRYGAKRRQTQVPSRKLSSSTLSNYESSSRIKQRNISTTTRTGWTSKIRSKRSTASSYPLNLKYIKRPSEKTSLSDYTFPETKNSNFLSAL